MAVKLTSSAKFLFSFLFIVVLTLGLFISFQSLLAAWTAPLANPATCASGNPGCDAPINIGSAQQYKAGTIGIGGFAIFDSSVGIGTGVAVPGYKLDVQGGQINASGGLCMAGACKTNWNEVSGSVTTNPANTWTGAQTFTDSVIISGTNTLNLTQTTNPHFYIDSNEGVRITLDKNTDDANSSFQINNGLNNTVFSVDESGATTINNAAGTAIFSVNSSGQLTTGSVPWARLTSFPAACPDGQYATAVGANLTCATPSVMSAGTSGQTLRHNGTTWIADSNLFNNGTNVGIGTTIPGAKLQINPPAGVEGLRIITASNFSPLNIRNNANTTDIFRVDQTGNIRNSSTIQKDTSGNVIIQLGN
ncbi:MAG: hypothetical protein V1801_02945 [Candidatus Falkowbacteria bacterium]